MFGKRLIVSGAIAILIGTLGACSGGGNAGGTTTYGQDDTTSTTTSTGSGSGSGSGSGGTASAQDDTVHGLKDSVRHVTAKTTRATRPRLVRKCSTATHRVRHTSSSGTGSKRKTRTWYTTERSRSCTKVRSGTETYRKTVRTEKWCVELDDVNGDKRRDDAWYQVSRSVYGDARTADDRARLEFDPISEGC
ncbi:hypothetical protein [Streptomyces fuscichromogenes]|uniref:Secreted protein n=1 Tax=Streptomyces fuscichromogenes TaxID=1324013 RepID=A0A918CUD0_9ACTN|nr:hypothetical protein [Streptomyces fuscichromogenes]GGN28394.1 hypothetical protein GCM10011578_064460 [Streptomyces fuscichromogenes]